MMASGWQGAGCCSKVRFVCQWFSFWGRDPCGVATLVGLRAFFGGVASRDGKAPELCLLESSPHTFIAIGR